MDPIDPWSPPAAGGEAALAPPGTVAVPQIVFRYRRARLEAIWSAHARRVLPWLRWPGVSGVVFWTIAAAVAGTTFGPAGFLAGAAVGIVAGGGVSLALLEGRWRGRGRQVFDQVDRLGWTDGAPMTVEVHPDRVRCACGGADVVFGADRLRTATRVDDTLFLWTNALAFVPIDGTEVTEGDLEGVAAAVARTLGTRTPLRTEALPLPDGIRIVQRPAGFVGQYLRVLVLTALARPWWYASVVLPLLSSVLAIWSPVFVVGLSLALVPLLLLAARIIGTQRPDRVELVVANGEITQRTPRGTNTWPLSASTGIHRFPGGEVWIRFDGIALFVSPSRRLDGDYAAFLRAVEDAVPQR